MNAKLDKKPKGVLQTMRAFAAAAALGLVLFAGGQSDAQAPTTPPVAEAAAPAAKPAVTPEAAPTAEAPAVAEAAPAEAAAIAAPEQTVDKGDTTWMLLSTMAVFLMIIPGLALFYGGLVRTKNMLSVLMQVSTVTVIGMVLYALVGYSLSFTDGGALNTFVGGSGRFFLADAGTDLSDNLAATFSTGIYIPELVFVVFQMTFACITASLVLGGLAERVKFIGVVLFAIAWPLLVYYPMAHMVWWWPGPDLVATGDAVKDGAVQGAGLIWNFGALDFAGGTVVHINSGIAALVGCIILGKRTGYKKEPMPPHSLTMVLIGTGLLWFGWFGFNAGSNLEANYYSALAMANTFLAPAAAGLSWTITEWVTKGKPSMLGMASGIVAGLVAVTPAAGFAGPVGALLLGLVVGPVCLFACSALKSMLGYDDALDVFGIHGV
ncbi:MAG: ammonium transporter, partial [Alphaproteobacteria bacterium]|nr:ammonium transporter [Alphaproteobacteria bacterium]